MSELPPPTWPPPPAPGAPIGAMQPSFAPPRPDHDTLPWRAGAGAVVVLVLSLIGSKLILDLLVDLDWPLFVYVAILGSLGYGPSIVWLRYASGRWGSGSALADVGARPRWADLGWGPLIWLAAIGVQLAISVVVIGLDVPISNNTDGIDELSADRSYVFAIVIAAVVAAPIVEELVFRGLVMRSALSRLRPVLAIPLQGVLFGVAHVDPVRGMGNIGLVVVLSGVGIVFGGFAYMLRRIGPTIVAHAIFNGVVMFLVLSGIADRIREENPDPFGSVVVGEQIAIVDQADVAEPDGGRDPD